MGFGGFPPEALNFFQQLKANNQREWFQPRKEEFEATVRGPMIELVQAINEDLQSFAPDHVVDPAKAIYRIYRDTRFSKDKTPYKTHIGASFHHRQSQKHICAGYYFHVSHEEIGIASGVYMPDPATLLTLRRAISADFEEFDAIVNEKRLKKAFGELQGERLSRVPKGFLPDDPAAEILKFKQLYFWQTIDPRIATTKKVRKELIDRFRLSAPFVNFVNSALRPSWKKAAKAAAFFE